MFHIIFFFSCKLFILDIAIRPVLLPMLEVMERGEALLVPRWPPWVTEPLGAGSSHAFRP